MLPGKAAPIHPLEEVLRGLSSLSGVIDAPPAPGARAARSRAEDLAWIIHDRSPERRAGPVIGVSPVRRAPSPARPGPALPAAGRTRGAQTR